VSKEEQVVMETMLREDTKVLLQAEKKALSQVEIETASPQESMYMESFIRKIVRYVKKLSGNKVWLTDLKTKA
jgi:type IV secretory pathway VirD2 relaxase